MTVAPNIEQYLDTMTANAVGGASFSNVMYTTPKAGVTAHNL